MSGEIDKINLTRWDIRKPIAFGNLICLSKSEIKKHLNLDPEKRLEYYGKEFMDHVESRFQLEAEYNKFRNL